MLLLEWTALLRHFLVVLYFGKIHAVLRDLYFWLISSRALGLAKRQGLIQRANGQRESPAGVCCVLQSSPTHCSFTSHAHLHVTSPTSPVKGNKKFIVNCQQVVNASVNDLDLSFCHLQADTFSWALPVFYPCSQTLSILVVSVFPIEAPEIKQPPNHFFCNSMTGNVSVKGNVKSLPVAY